MFRDKPSPAWGVESRISVDIAQGTMSARVCFHFQLLLRVFCFVLDVFSVS